MNRQEKITVIVPVYNIMEYLPRCVKSITEQTYDNLEIILVDDGSTDGTGELCDRQAELDDRIRVFHKENGGSSSARNLGLKKATGAYIGFIDSDDYIEPWMFDTLYEGMIRENASIVQIGRDEVNPDGTKRPDVCTPPAQPEKIEAEDFMRELLMHRGDCSFCTKLVRREVLGQEEFPEGILNEDFHLLVRILPGASSVLSLPGYGYHVFYRENSNSRKKNKEEFSRVYADCVENADMMERLVREHYPDLVKVSVRFAVFQRLEYLLHIPISRMRRDNEFYRAVVKYLRRNWGKGMGNPFLTRKNKVYMTLFCIAPKGLRKIHRRLRRKAMEAEN